MDPHFLPGAQASVMETASLSFSDLVELVRQGYKTAAVPYHNLKDNNILSLPIYHHWLSLVPEKGIVAELGCGSGYPVAHHIASLWKGTGRQYIGVDLSEEQIDIAKASLCNDSDIVGFTVREMCDWCKKQRDNSISGIIGLFSVFHLPRSQHVELFSHIQRILTDRAPLLFTCPESSTEGFEDKWLGASRMYWSSFSSQWYETTLQDLGFEFVSKSKEIKNFMGQKEVTYYLLYQKPQKEDPRAKFIKSLQQSRGAHSQAVQNQPQPGYPSIPSSPMYYQVGMSQNEMTLQ